MIIQRHLESVCLNQNENDATTKYTNLKIKPSSQNLRFIFFSSSSCVCWTGTSCGASESIMIKRERRNIRLKIANIFMWFCGAY